MRTFGAVVLGLGVAACGGDHEFEPPDVSERVARADTLFDETLFDSLVWEDDSRRALEGNAVFAAKCRNCHGPLGRGGTPYALERRLEVPSLVEEDWEFGTDLSAVRRRIFVGHPAGMPTWGVAGIPPREIDAVAFFILHDLRPEVLGSGRGSGPPNARRP
jgi:hypothetical protein